MHCETANAQLVEYASGELSPVTRVDVEQHVSGCATCQADLAAIQTLQGMAESWQDEALPPHPAGRHSAAALTPRQQAHGPGWLDQFRIWFPTFASAAALVLVAVVYIQQPADNGMLPSQTAGAGYEALPRLPQTATQAALVQSVLESSKEQRAKEIQALLKVLKAEMDKRSIQTEESLRYIITHQIQGQQELDELYRQVETLMNEELAGPGSPPAGLQDGGLNEGNM